jgi:hypothetical protein
MNKGAYIEISYIKKLNLKTERVQIINQKVQIVCLLFPIMHDLHLFCCFKSHPNIYTGSLPF